MKNHLRIKAEVVRYFNNRTGNVEFRTQITKSNGSKEYLTTTQAEEVRLRDAFRRLQAKMMK